MNRTDQSGIGLRVVIGVAVLFSALLPPYIQAIGGKGRRTYHNKRWDFCVEYPATWGISESYTRNGAYVYPRRKERPFMGPTISFGGEVAQSDETDPSRHETLEASFLGSVEEMKHSRQFKDVEILEKHSTEFLGYPALASTIRFSYTTSQVTWVGKDLVLQRPDGFNFFVSVETPAEELATMTPVFEDVVRSFRFGCRAAK